MMSSTATTPVSTNSHPHNANGHSSQSTHSSSLEEQCQGQSQGFWEVGGYRANVQRMKDGSEQLEELSKMVKERVEIENNYGRSLQKWQQKWSTFSNRQLPEGCVRRVFDDVLLESKELARLHLAVKDRCNDEVIRTISLFKKDNYHRSAIRGFRQAKEIEDEFEKAQRQWRKLFERLEMAKKAYHSACRNERSASIQLMNSQSDTSLSQDGNEKARERHERSRLEVQRTRTSYEQQLAEIRQYNGVYSKNMAFVFEKCQQMELKRMKFVVEMLGGMQNVLVELAHPPKLSQIHADLESSIRCSLDDAHLNGDLKRWAQQHGTDAPSQPLTFEDYKPELRCITAVSMKNASSAPAASEGHNGDGGVVLMKKVLKCEDEPVVGAHKVAGVGQRREPDHRPAPPYSAATRSNGNAHGQGHGRASSGESSDPPPSLPMSIIISEMPTIVVGGGGGGASSGASGASAASERSCPINGNGRAVRMDAGMLSPKAVEPLNWKSNGSNKGGSSTHPQSQPRSNGTSSVTSGAASPSHTPGNTSAPIRGMARVLYNYEPMEAGEIKLVKGEYLDLLSGPDHLGWCLGRKPPRDDRKANLGGGKHHPHHHRTGLKVDENGELLEGLFPAGYVQKV